MLSLQHTCLGLGNCVYMQVMGDMQANGLQISHCQCFASTPSGIIFAAIGHTAIAAAAFLLR